jgi:O-succinylhomoserine sulfhydrylase
MTDELHPRTKLVHGGTDRSGHHEMSEALYLTQGFAYPDAETAEARFDGSDPGYVYARYGNPTVGMFEQRLALLEGAEACFATASGMAAMNASMFSQLQSGDHVVASRALFGSCHYILDSLLPRFGVQTTLVEGTDITAWQNAVRPETKVFFLETPSNPTLEIIDIRAVADVAHEAGAVLVVDNVFATPCFQRPLALGADIVMYSTTKHIDGQGRCLGGALLGSKEFVGGKLLEYMKHTGAAMSPFNAWVMLKGLETLDLRCRAAADSAEAIAQAVEGHSAVARAIHPGLSSHPQHALAAAQMERPGTMVSFELKGGKDAAFRFMNALEVVRISNNLGDAKSIATHPTTTTHQRMTEEDRLSLGITSGLIRLSVGLEHADDLIRDISRGLDAA